ncbi:MAG TPA: NAD(P)-dependent alcohol dehydrogenase [Conexivisphaerales archaeon]|nr:NAD(P)-dependent alcohol dehydrogenase [Conexivisphaerales archaeon]
MKAAVYTRYGPPDILKIADVERPVPKDDEVLVEVHAASLNAGDWYLMRGKPFLVRMAGGGLMKPRNQRLGADLAGRVVAIGAGITKFKPGDEVFGDTGIGSGSIAEYACARESDLVLKPASMAFEEAAAVPLASVTALIGLRDEGRVQPGQKVLINGGSGGVGTFAVQIAKAMGAEVTATCSPGKVDLLRSIGADRVIDYTKEDCTREGPLYDVILGVNGYHPLWAYGRALKQGGIYIMVGGSMGQILQGFLLSRLIPLGGGKRIGVVGVTTERRARASQDLAYVKELIEAGKVKPVIDRLFPIDETAEALRYAEEGHVRGKVVITVANRA